MRTALILYMSLLLILSTALARAEVDIMPAQSVAITEPAAGGNDDEATLAVAAEVLSYDLPPYAPGARVGAGKMQTHIAGEQDTLLDIARHYKMGFVEIRAANPDIDPWSPVPGEEIIIPSFHLLPRVKEEGIVVNLSEMRLYFFRTPNAAPISFPIGVGREGLATPTGETTIVRKTEKPTWYPTERMREENPWLPAAIPPGPQNPLGTHALYLGWPTFLIHGSNKPWAIGRRVSSGCMRMYAENIAGLFKIVPVGTKVNVVDQPILTGWVGDTLYLEAHPTKPQSNEIEIEGTFTVEEMNDEMKKLITVTAGDSADAIDWKTAEAVIRERRGYPVAIARRLTPEDKSAAIIPEALSPAAGESEEESVAEPSEKEPPANITTEDDDATVMEEESLDPGTAEEEFFPEDETVL